MKTVTVEEAQSDLQHLLELVAQGEAVVITRDGTVVARLEPAAPTDRCDNTNSSDADREAAVQRMVKRMREGIRMGGYPATRDEMHER